MKLTHPERDLLNEVRRLGAMSEREAGQFKHARWGRHSPVKACKECSHDGKVALEALEDKGLVARRYRTTIWEPTP